jgi:nicotinic acid phosphoribosyltransferase
MCFIGDVETMPEGTVFFADEPVLRITAPLREAQFVESRVLNWCTSSARCRWMLAHDDLRLR